MFVSCPLFIAVILEYGCAGNLFCSGQRGKVLVMGSEKGVDVLDPNGTLSVRVQTNFTVQNSAWTGANFVHLWMLGESGIARVGWNVKERVLV